MCTIYRISVFIYLFVPIFVCFFNPKTWWICFFCPLFVNDLVKRECCFFYYWFCFSEICWKKILYLLNMLSIPCSHFKKITMTIHLQKRDDQLEVANIFFYWKSLFILSMSCDFCWIWLYWILHPVVFVNQNWFKTKCSYYSYV